MTDAAMPRGGERLRVPVIIRRESDMVHELMATAALFTAVSGLPVEAQTVLLSSTALVAMAPPASAQDQTIQEGSANDPQAAPPAASPAQQPAVDNDATPPVARTNYPASDFLLGDFGGARNRLDDAGVKLSAGLVTDTAYNAAGGFRKDVYWAGQLAVAAAFDMGKIAGIDGGTLTVNISHREGKNLTARVGLGLLQQAQAIFGRGNITRISELSYEQQLANGVVSIKAGRLDMGADFNEFSCKFMNLTFCYLTLDHIAGDNFFAYPVSMWAARAKVKLRDDLFAKVGVYDINPRLATKGFSFNTSRSTGTNVMTELDWQPKLGPAGLPGIYRGGVGYSTADRNDTFRDVNGRPYLVTGSAPAVRRDHWVYWLQGQQQVTGTGGATPTGLTVFANFTQTDDRVVQVDQVINAGLFYSGAIPSRPLDEIGLAVGRSHISDRLARGQRARNATPGLTPVAVQDAEYPIELYYGLSFGKAATLRPNVQYIIRPGGTKSNNDAFVLGLRTVMNF